MVGKITKVGAFSNVSNSKTVKGKGIQNFAFYRTQTARPQLKFKTPPDNVEGSPWRPLLKEKPNAMIPLDQSLQVGENGEEGLEYDLFGPSLIVELLKTHITTKSQTPPILLKYSMPRNRQYLQLIWKRMT